MFTTFPQLMTLGEGSSRHERVLNLQSRKCTELAFTRVYWHQIEKQQEKMMVLIVMVLEATRLSRVQMALKLLLNRLLLHVNCSHVPL